MRNKQEILIDAVNVMLCSRAFCGWIIFISMRRTGSCSEKSSWNELIFVSACNFIDIWCSYNVSVSGYWVSSWWRRQDQTIRQLSDPVQSWYQILSFLDKEEELPIKDIGNKAVLVLAAGLGKILLPNLYILSFLKGERVSLRGLACKEVLLSPSPPIRMPCIAYTRLHTGGRNGKQWAGEIWTSKGKTDTCISFRHRT